MKKDLVIVPIPKSIKSRNFQYDHVMLSKRQIGSTFKPFLYATVLMGTESSQINDIFLKNSCSHVSSKTSLRKLLFPLSLLFYIVQVFRNFLGKKIFFLHQF